MAFRARRRRCRLPARVVWDRLYHAVHICPYSMIPNCATSVADPHPGQSRSHQPRGRSHGGRAADMVAGSHRMARWRRAV